ncbi:GreA/GreB family elongation factor [Streptomyces termitum]|uniref:Transcription elongation factor GreA n=1 Tax=Streptomyces termitum TaxID=67368 RepID=A0A918WB62_9ACTN|nr:GreA/GreB family elongation factor [Streptomyces termitum]GHA93412.1 transcription elongation factor GreA [Streptomyces termitum]
MTAGPEPLSDAARAALDRELSDLRTERAAVAATLGGGDEPGDRADQADELQRATELEKLDARIGEVEGRLREGAAAGAPSTEAVGVGSTVRLRFGDGTESTVHIGELADAGDPALVTADSPLGRALLGRAAGESVAYATPLGRTTAVVVSVGGRS